MMITPLTRHTMVFADDIQMGDINLKQPLPTRKLTHADPFLLLHHVGPLDQQPGESSVLDIGGHPHRGFEPVTFIFKGKVHHRDSRGNDSIINAGGVQWMTAGMGIVHSESAPKEWVEEGGQLELIQLWVNLPSHLKMSQPRYQGFQEEDIPTIEINNGKSTINVIAGTLMGRKGPVDSVTGIHASTITIKAESELVLDLIPEHNTVVYQIEGKALINDQESAAYNLSHFPDHYENISIKAEEYSRFLVVSGEPINEPVTQHGPFVMNNQTEILEAMRDYQMGKMGILI
ncbi:MAG: pirin family protein [Saprospiraceae bacterium]|nr:pirin family protein [Saprospiraceae bacterium]